MRQRSPVPRHIREWLARAKQVAVVLLRKFHREIVSFTCGEQVIELQHSQPQQCVLKRGVVVDNTAAVLEHLGPLALVVKFAEQGEHGVLVRLRESRDGL